MQLLSYLFYYVLVYKEREIDVLCPIYCLLFPSFLLFTSPRRGERAKRKRAQALALCAHTVSFLHCGKTKSERGTRFDESEFRRSKKEI